MLGADAITAPEMPATDEAKMPLCNQLLCAMESFPLWPYFPFHSFLVCTLNSPWLTQKAMGEVNRLNRQ